VNVLRERGLSFIRYKEDGRDRNKERDIKQEMKTEEMVEEDNK
jgi:hypothetical protein